MPERNAQKKAFNLLPVAQQTGIATQMPSGMLCRAIAKANAPPMIEKDIDQLNN